VDSYGILKIMRVSNTSLGNLKDCPRKYQYIYEMGIEPKIQSWALLDGEATHLALERFYKGGAEEPGRCTELMEKTAQECQSVDNMPVYEVVEDFYDNLDDDIYPAVEYHRHLTMGMVAGYTLLYNSDEFGAVETEKKYTLEVCGERLVVKIDRLAERNNKWWIHEVKTTSDDTRKRFLQRIEMDFQPTCYMYAVRRSGYDVVGVLYDVLKKPKIRQWSLETEEQFHFRLVRTLVHGIDTYFFREPVYRDEDDLAEFERTLKVDASHIDLYRQQGEWSKSPHRCHDWSSECGYLPLCKEADKNRWPDIIAEQFIRRYNEKDKPANQN
jgi:hypothetical protein